MDGTINKDALYKEYADKLRELVDLMAANGHAYTIKEFSKLTDMS